MASVRHVYPDVPLRLLLGGPVRLSLLDELKSVWNVGVATVPQGDYGWGFIKLEPLFQERRERFLVLDSDTALLGPVLSEDDDASATFLVDDETQSDADQRRLYYDWEKVRTVDPTSRRPQFVFNSGQWIGSSGSLRRDDFARWIHWDMPRTLRHPEVFMPGDQGILNYVLNQKVRFDGLRVARKKIMRWPGHDVSDLDSIAIARGQQSPHRTIMHWAGFKAPRLESLPRADLLLDFERLYYERHVGGERLRRARAWRAGLEFRMRELRVRMKLRMQKTLAGVAA